MFKVLLAALTGLVGAGLLHLVIILSLPAFAQHDAYNRVLDEGAPFRFHVMGKTADAAGLLSEDPFLETAVCAFDLSEQPVRLSAGNGVPFWSLASFDDASNETFSINDRTSAGRALDIIVATPVQATALRKAIPASLMQSIIVETHQPQGYAVLRAMAPKASYKPMAAGFLAGASCAALPLP
ncbi:DUF1254 domain-containing protein [Rhizobium sp. FY34]|uniref:DUF1254 domain-containing protein n=1 Tax=Rhizobium sp. FY34 TaxID=2562309 RepID=UPI0010BF963D|nr:DUF1254 domain-containing protein [Rhizobium sp. FY34]